MSSDGIQDQGPPCTTLIGDYDKIKKECSESGGQAHHIVPDYTLRTTNRAAAVKDTVWGITRVADAENMLFKKGPSICLKGQKADPLSEHGRAHKFQDPLIAKAGATSRTTPDGKTYPEGTAPLGEILDISKTQVSKVKPECSAEIAAAVDDGFKDIDKSTPCRTTEGALPKNDAASLLCKTSTNKRNL